MQTQLPLGPLMVDIAGLTLSDEERTFLAHPNIGAVILFARNFQDPGQLQQLVTEIKAVRYPELLIAVDQEGGRVQRFGHPFTKLPAISDLEAIYDENPETGLKVIEAAAHVMAHEILSAGIDISFAPVIDVGNHASKVLHQRTFSNHAEKVTRLASHYITALQSVGMRTTGKHFPGHGGVCEDSHLEMPVDSRDLLTIEQRDLGVFKSLAPKLDAVMTAHVAFPNIDDQLPTFSPFWLKQLLREQIGFNGTIFSDDLIMHGACEQESDIVKRAQLSFSAGCDIALICNDPEAARICANARDFTENANHEKVSAMKAKPQLLPESDYRRAYELLAEYFNLH